MRPLSNKEKRILQEVLEKEYSIYFRVKLKKENIIFDDKNRVYILNRKPIAFIYGKKIFPTLLLLIDHDFKIPYIVVDRGAKEKILNGADVFRPGITKVDKEIKRDKAVIIISEDEKLLALGLSLYAYEEIQKMNKGKVIRNLHYYGDRIFKLYQKLQSK
ncbi:MAG TPA: DUF1947 domain-containing protein [Candidatus Nanopusillus sp.]|nr:DUF1947 domain-containing protein [Candidatus Nanopusillus sp.]HIP90369.1 DUF1947 domain-containing protein [Candidatus Nanopusillus sp.]